MRKNVPKISLGISAILLITAMWPQFCLAAGRRIVGHVVDQAEKPIVGARLTITNNQNRPGFQTQARTVRNGSFSFERLQDAHSYTLTVKAEGYCPLTAGIGLFPSTFSESYKISLVRQLPEPPTRGGFGAIKGRIVDMRDGGVLPGASVRLDSTILGAPSYLDGTFLIPDVPSGKYSVTVIMVGYSKTRVEGISVWPDSTVIANINISPMIVRLDRMNQPDGRPPFDRYITHLEKKIDSEELDRLPYRKLEEILERQPGFVK